MGFTRAQRIVFQNLENVKVILNSTLCIFSLNRKKIIKTEQRFHKYDQRIGYNNVFIII